MADQRDRALAVLCADPLGKALWDRAQLAVQLEDARRALDAAQSDAAER